MLSLQLDSILIQEQLFVVRPPLQRCASRTFIDQSRLSYWPMPGNELLLDFQNRNGLGVNLVAPLTRHSKAASSRLIFPLWGTLMDLLQPWQEIDQSKQRRFEPAEI
jgi:hypothetical protein